MSLGRFWLATFSKYSLGKGVGKLGGLRPQIFGLKKQRKEEASH